MLEKKSYGISLILTILLGPLGLFYSSIPAAIIVLFITIFMFPVGWILAIVFGYVFVESHNIKVNKIEEEKKKEEMRHQELIQAIREREKYKD